MRNTLFCLAAMATLALPGSPRAQALPAVSLIRAPEGALQPQAAADARGRIHVVYFKGEPANGDLFYSTLDDRGGFGAPLQVNTQPGVAIATGTIRGGHLAIGRNGRVHVAWSGSQKAPKPAGDSVPVLYTRLNDAGTKFEPERSVVQQAVGLDGATIAADTAGRVYVAWHAGLPGMKGEADRRVFVAASRDDGRTFAPQAAASPASTGACGCCGVGALADARDGLFVLYRAAIDSSRRDAYVLSSRDGGATYAAASLQRWDINACPMSSFALARDEAGALAGWETDGQVQWTRVDPATGRGGALVVPAGTPKNRKHPALAVNRRGDILMVWTEGTGWNKGGSLAWQQFNRNGEAVGERGSAAGVPTWGLATAAARPDGSFVIIY